MRDDIREQLRTFYAGEIRVRATRPLADERTVVLDGFVAELERREASSVVEVGCGAGRDGVVIRDAGFDYTGTDLSSEAVTVCRERGLSAVESDATALPFADATFDAAWSMSTLMHLPGDDLRPALAELARVVRPRGIVEIGVWGHDTGREWTSPDGRYFNQRSDNQLRAELLSVGHLLDFRTWQDEDDEAHYQWARVEIAGR